MTITDAGGAVLTLMLGYRKIEIAEISRCIFLKLPWFFMYQLLFIKADV